MNLYMHLYRYIIFEIEHANRQLHGYRHGHGQDMDMDMEIDMDIEMDMGCTWTFKKMK
jgi:hypothetical protein